jgi:PAS domain S-box-containing protein
MRKLQSRRRALPNERHHWLWAKGPRVNTPYPRYHLSVLVVPVKTNIHSSQNARLRQTSQKAREGSVYAEAIMESIPPFLVLDSDLRVKTANESFCEHFQVSRPQTENCLVYDLGNRQWNIPELRLFLEKVLPQHSFFRNFEVTHDFEGIGRRTMLLSGRQVDHLQRILLFIDDVTDRQKSQAALNISEIRYRRLFEAARDGILILDPRTRRIADANPFMSELLGYAHEDLLGKELWEIGLLKDEEASRTAFQELQKDGYIRYEDLPLQTSRGVRREVEFVSNLYQENGSKVIQCNIRDITERKRAEHELMTAKDEISHHAQELEKTVRERTGELRDTIGELEAFSYSLSHDMRAPLRAMRGFAALLVQHHAAKLDAEGLEYLEKINTAAARMDTLIQDVLIYSRVAGEKMTLVPIDANKLLREVIESYPQLAASQAEIHIEGSLPKVLGNDASLAQCMSNLLSNAVKFIAPKAKPSVGVRAQDMGPEVRLWIEDNGIGIAPKDQKRIFTMFERVHPESAYEGTGIGLAIVRKATERMGGSVGVQSEVGHGSKFWIQLRKG